MFGANNAELDALESSNANGSGASNNVSSLNTQNGATNTSANAAANSALNATSNNLNSLNKNNVLNNTGGNNFKNAPANATGLSNNAPAANNGGLANNGNTLFNNGKGNVAPATNAPPPTLNSLQKNAVSANLPDPLNNTTTQNNTVRNAVPQKSADFTGQTSMPPGEAESSPADSEMQSYNSQLEGKLRERLSGDLSKYCMDYCSILSLDVFSNEVFETASSDLGFEGTSAAQNRRFSAHSATAEVMVDSRFGQANIEKLQSVFLKLLSKYPLKVQLQWSTVTFPDSAVAAKSENQVRSQFTNQVRNQLEKVVAEYCPRDCKVHDVEIDVSRAGVDEVQNGNPTRFLFSKDGKGSLFLKGVKANVSLNSQMDNARKDRLRALFNETLFPFGAMNIQFKELVYPKSAEEVSKDLDEVRGDPWGLKKLGEALKIFREFANTKEIIRESSKNESSLEANSENNSSTEKSESENALKETNSANNSTEKNLTKSELEKQSEKNSETSSENSTLNKENSNTLNKESSLLNSESGATFWTEQRLWMLGAGLLALILVGALGLRFVVTGKRMQQVINEGRGQSNNNSSGYSSSSANPIHSGGQDSGQVFASLGQGSGGAQVLGFSGSGGVLLTEESKKRMQLDSLREELVQTFVQHPKVARDVFTRLIREDTMENSAKLVFIFGELMFYELLGDADLKKDIYTLAEFIHVNAPRVEIEEQLEILKNLKMKLTAGKLRIMSSSSLDMFDFLKSKSPRQIIELIHDENAKSQSMVLTQLPTEKRRSVFELFEGQSKIDLLKELSTNNVVQREYLFNLAEALKRKSATRPGFSGENVQGTDVLLDLLERAELDAQRNLMFELDRNSPDIARMLRTRLVTVETLPYLRDGLLLEVFLSMDHSAMATFLAGTQEHIRQLVLSKAPRDMADNWIESLSQIRSIDAESLKLAELQVLTKIRAFSSQGLVNLLEVNLALYPREELAGEGGDRETGEKTKARVFRISNPLVA